MNSIKGDALKFTFYGVKEKVYSEVEEETIELKIPGGE